MADVGKTVNMSWNKIKNLYFKIVNETCSIACKQITYLPKKWKMITIQFKILRFQIEMMHLQFQNAVLCPGMPSV